MINLEIPLLAPKHISEFSPAEYRTYVTSLYMESVQVSQRKEAAKPKVNFKFTRTGKFSITVSKRDPKYLTQLEFQLLAKKHKIPQNDLFLYLKKRKILLKDMEENHLTEKALNVVKIKTVK